MSTPNNQESEQRYKCIVHGDLRTLEEAKTCRYYKKTKCLVYRHICSIWESDNQDYAQSSAKWKEEQEKYIDEKGLHTRLY